MQGVILSAGTAQGIILDDDGARYTFTPLGWRNDAVRPEAGMRVDFEARGSHAVGIYPLPGVAPTPPAQPPLATPTPSATPPPVTGGRPSQPTQAPTSPPTPGSFPMAQRSPSTQVATGGLPTRPPTAVAGRERGGMKWLWALMGVGALVALGIVGAVMLDVLPMFGGSTKVAEPPQFWLSREPEGNAHEILAGGSFTLRVRLSGEPESNLLAKLGVVEPADKRIGISVSFPSLTESSSLWDPDEVDFKSPAADIKSNTWPRDKVSFHRSGATVSRP